jgi:hypothetical protein
MFTENGLWMPWPVGRDPAAVKRDTGIQEEEMSMLLSDKTVSHRCALASAVLVVALGIAASASSKQPFTVKGEYVEGCSCMGVCPCELTGLMDGCQGLGVIAIASGSYMGKDLSGSRIAYATVPGQWVRLYVEPRSRAQTTAVEAYARAVYSAFGKIESIREARVKMAGHDGRYNVTVDGGKVASFTTVPVLGGDNRTPIVHSNVKDPVIHSVMQGKTVAGAYHDGKRSFTLKGTNSYFNNHISSSGKV